MKKLIGLLFAIALLSVQAFAQQTTGNITAAGTACGGTNCVIYAVPNNGLVGTVAVQITGSIVGTVQFE